MALKIKKKKTRLIISKIVRTMKKNIKIQKSESETAIAKNVFIYSGGKIEPSIKSDVEDKKKEKSKEKKGVSIDVSSIKTAVTPVIEKSINVERIKIVYPLIPENPKKGEKIFAYAYITFDKNLNEIVYNVVEPRIGGKERETIEKVKYLLEEKLDIDLTKVGEIKAKEIVKKHASSILKSMGISMNRIDTLKYYINRDLLGLGKIEPLMKDPNIEDISCDGIGVPIFVYHRNPILGSLRTNIVFENSDELDSFVMKLAQKCGKSVSVAEPLVDGSLPDGSRVQATLGTDIARRGSNFTIRKFTSKPLTPIHMLKYKTLDSTQLAYFWLAVEHKKSILISGGTATGKTSLLNALSLFIRPSLKVISIEDTAELRLPHPHWVPEVARTPIESTGSTGEVSLFDLLKASLRQRPDYIVVGEVRGKEAYVLFQQIATGHAGLATIHAATVEQLLDRLTTPPISLPATLIENLDIIVFLVRVRIGDKYVRRANNIIEIEGVKNERPLIRTIFRWDPATDSYAHKAESIVLKNIAELMNMSEEQIRQEIAIRRSVLEWMLEKNIMDYRDVANVINMYYTNPERVIGMVESL